MLKIGSILWYETNSYLKSQFVFLLDKNDNDEFLMKMAFCKGSGLCTLWYSEKMILNNTLFKVICE